MMNIRLDLLPISYCVARLELSDDIPADVRTSKEFYSFSKSDTEASLLCAQVLLPINVTADRDWRLFQYAGSMDEKIVGVVARIANTLAEKGIGIIVVTTYDSGYFGVRTDDLENSLQALRSKIYTVNS